MKFIYNLTDNNSRQFLIRKHTIQLFISLLIISASSCKKEKTFVYDVNTVNVNSETGEKINAKTTTEFISIAYSDLFGNTISQDKLFKLNIAYTSFGDKKLIEDRIIRNFLNDASVIIPSDQNMRSDIPAFITNAYKKFFNRLPDEFEKYYLVNLIQTDTDVTAVDIYYSMMTSTEYRYY
jgi:hypothetical protein